MKKIITFITLVLVLVSIKTQAQTQTNASNPASTNVNIILSDFISIDGSSVANGGSVDFNYTTAGDYDLNRTVSVPNSLVVTSSENFNIIVKAEGENFVNGSSTIPVNVLRIKATTTGASISGQSGIELSNTDQTLVSSVGLGYKKSIGIDYTISAINAREHLLGKAAGTYTQIVTYTATAL